MRRRTEGVPVSATAVTPQQRAGSDALPLVSVIVPVLNGEATLRRCLVSLLQNDYPKERREILVVDNGSVDGTRAIARAFPVRYLFEPRKGVSYARNKGIRESTGNILAFFDADCIATKSWLRELALGFEDDDVGVVVGEVVAFPPRTVAESYMAARKPLIQAFNMTRAQLSSFGAGNMAVRRQVFATLGGFDLRFSGAAGEDIDFALRLARKPHFKVQYRPRAMAFHRHRITVRALFEQAQRNGRAQAILHRKYPREIPWSWRHEMKACQDLVTTGCRAGGRLLGLGRPGGKESSKGYLYLDLVRKLGQRIGFWRGLSRRYHA